MAEETILCQSCGIEAPTRFVEFHQNIGMLLMRRTGAVKGSFCKNCVHSHFWKRTLITLGVGWLGTISIIIAPVFILMNVARYLGALGMKAVPPGAAKPVLNDAIIAKVAPHIGGIFQRLNQGETLTSVARAIATQAGVTPGQVVIYTLAVAAANKQQDVQKTYGFPVQPAAVKAVPPPLPAPSVARDSTLAPMEEPIPPADLTAEDELGLR